MDYPKFLENLDKELENYFNSQAPYIHCKKGCADCCKKGDYPMTDIELKYLMLGYEKLDLETKATVQENIKKMKKGEACPFLINNECSVYNHRPIICRVHGLAYLYNDNTVKLPYCRKTGKNYASLYNNGVFTGSPIKENLETIKLMEGFNYGEIRNLYDWYNIVK